MKEFKDFKKQVNESNFKDKCEKSESDSKSLSDEMIKSHFDNEILRLKKSFEDQFFHFNKKFYDFSNSIDIAFIKTVKLENSQIRQNEEYNARILLDLHKKFSQNETELNLQRINSKILEDNIHSLNNQDINIEITMNGLIKGKLLLDDKVQKLEGQVDALEKDMKNANHKIQSLEKRVAKLERKLFKSKIFGICSSIPFFGSFIQATMNGIDALEDVVP
jgi:chromosome segregation ATPase